MAKFIKVNISGDTAGQSEPILLPVRKIRCVRPNRRGGGADIHLSKGNYFKVKETVEQVHSLLQLTY